MTGRPIWIFGILLLLTTPSQAQEIEEILAAQTAEEIVEILKAQHEAELRKARDIERLVEPFQEKKFTIKACDENLNKFGYPSDYFEIGSTRAFRGSGFQVIGKPRGTIRFWIRPSGKYIRTANREIPLYSQNQWLTQMSFESVSVGSGPLVTGRLIPVFGCLYRVTGYSIPDRAVQGANIELQKIPAKEWPAGVTLDPLAYALTDGGGIGLGMYGGEIGISADFNKAEARFDLTLSLSHWTPDRRHVEHTKQVILVKERTLVQSRFARDVRFRVVSVVPPDSKTTCLAGWSCVVVWPRLVPFGIDESLPIERRVLK